MTERTHDQSHAHAADEDLANGAAPARLQRRVANGSTPAPSAPAFATAGGLAVQLFADAVSAGVHSTGQIQRAAMHGLSGPSGAMPHLGAIQQSFGRHDVSAIQAHVGGAAAEGSAAMGAHGFAAGDHVAFAASPDLHLAAHEAAHVVQQRAGVSLKGGVGQVGDAYETHADAVADLVVQGKSAESLLDTMAPSAGSSSSGVQQSAIQLDVTDEDPRLAVRAPSRRARASERAHRHPARSSDHGAMPEGISIAVGDSFSVSIVSHDLHIPFSPYAFVTEAGVTGSVGYHLHEPAGAEPHAEGPVEVEAGIGSHGPGVEVEAAHEVCSIFGLGHFDVAATAELNSHEGTIGLSAGGGSLTLPHGLRVPLPEVSVDLVEWEVGHPPNFLVGQVRIPLTVTRAISVPLPGGRSVELIPQLTAVFKLGPNWTTIASQLGLGMESALATEAATVEAATAFDAAATAGASEATMAEVAAEGVTMINGAVGEAVVGGAVIEGLALAAVVLAPIGAMAFMAGMLADADEVLDIQRRADATGHTVFTYCLAYISAWAGTPAIGGVGGSEGHADGLRDIAAARARHASMNPREQLQHWGIPAVYQLVFDGIAPRAISYEIARNTASSGSMDDLVIRDAIDSYAWHGEARRRLFPVGG